MQPDFTSRFARIVAPIGLLSLLMQGCSHAPTHLPGDARLRLPGETRIDALRSITPGGSNSEATWSPDGKCIAYRHVGPECGQIQSVQTDGKELKRHSKDQLLGNGPAFLPNSNERLAFGVAESDAACAEPAKRRDQSRMVKIDEGTDRDSLAFEPGQPSGRNADLAICSDGSALLSSDREGGLEIFRGKVDKLGTLGDLLQLTHSPALDREPTFSRDCKRIAWQSDGEIWIADADGKHARQVTRTRGKSSAPAFTPNGEALVFASSERDPEGKRTDLMMIRLDGTRLERVTYSDAVEKDPTFSPDGKTLAFSSSRALAPGAAATSDPQILLADWVEPAATTPGPTTESATSVAKELKELEGARTWGLSCGKVRPIVIAARASAPDAAGDTLSGVSALEQVTQTIVASGPPARGHCFVFVKFAPEETTGFASDRPARLLKKLMLRPKAILSVDAVGRIEDNHVIAYGLATAREWESTVAAACATERLLCDHGGDEARASSLPAAFFIKGTPTVHFSSDPANPILQSTGVAQVASAIAQLALRTMPFRAPLHFKKSSAIAAPAVTEAPPAATPTPVPAPTAKTGPSGRAYLGAIPDYSAIGQAAVGVPIAGARAGSPAAKAGLKGKDVLFAIETAPTTAGGERVRRKTRTVEDLTQVVSSLKPEEEVTLLLRRGAQELTLPAKLGKRD